MKAKKSISKQTKDNWMIDITLLISALFASISGIYFLYLPSGGYQGGRNPYYGSKVLFERHTWSDIHTWTGILMIAVILIHVPLHWNWIVSMGKRLIKQIFGNRTKLNAYSRFNIFINFLVGLSFIITAVTGIYLLFVPGGSKGAYIDPMILFSRTTWDLIHTWSGVLVIIAGLVHFTIHWKWITKVTRKVLSLDTKTADKTFHYPEFS